MLAEQFGGDRQQSGGLGKPGGAREARRGKRRPSQRPPAGHIESAEIDARTKPLQYRARKEAADDDRIRIEELDDGRERLRQPLAAVVDPVDEAGIALLEQGREEILRELIERAA
nr:hypothetical protein [Rhizobium lentis]